MEIMLNEHHQTATCVDPAAPLVLAALARLTKKARLLILGNPIANRRQPVRVAEEMAMVDVLSRGRLEAGFVRGVPYEVLPANSNPVRMNERQWEALDLIIKAWTTHDGPFSHEGRFFHYRAGEHLAAPLSAAASADLDQHHQPRRRGACRCARVTCRRRSSPASTARGRSSTPIAAAGARQGAATTCRRIGWPMPRWSILHRTRQRRVPGRRSCCGTSPRTRCRRISPIRRAMCRCRPTSRCCAAPSIR